MLKWLCENCNQYRPYTQELCHCTHDPNSMFGDDWDEPEFEIHTVTRRRRENRERVASTAVPQNA